MRKYFIPLFLLILFTTFTYAQWTQLFPVPCPWGVGPGGGITYSGGYIWVIVGNEDDGFYIYDIASSDWIPPIAVDDLPEDIYDAGAITFEDKFHRRIFVAAIIEDEPDQLFVYTKYISSSWEGEWNDPDEVLIQLPEGCGRGVSLVFQSAYNSTIAGWLYLLVGGENQYFYRKAFEVLEDPDGFYPPNDSQISQSSLIFDWKPSNEALIYQFQLDRTKTFGSPIIDTLITESEFIPSEGRLGNGIYYWRVRFKRNYKMYEWSNWSCSMRFILGNSGRPRIVYSYPPDKSIVATNRLTFDWAPVGRITRYQVQIDNDSMFLSPLIDTLIGKSEFKIQLANGRYWWHVRFMSEGGQWNDWSITSSLEIQTGWVPLDNIHTAVNYGGSLCYDAYSKSLFALVGGGNPYIYRYDINSGSWDENPNGTPLGADSGSSIVSGPPASYLSRLAAVFGWSDELKPHYPCWFYPPYTYYWHPSQYQLQEILGSGASLAYDSRNDHLYLVIGGERSNFWYNPDPWYYGEEGPQIQQTIDLLQKSKISYDFDKLVIHYSTDASTRVGIQIYDLMGKQIKKLFSTKVEKGEHQVVWDKTDNSNQKVASGIYFITIVKEGRPEGLKVIIR